MLFLIQRLTKKRPAGSRTRLFYMAIAIAFVALAGVGVGMGNVAVAVIAAVVAVVTMGVATLAPRLSGG